MTEAELLQQNVLHVTLFLMTYTERQF